MHSVFDQMIVIVAEIWFGGLPAGYSGLMWYLKIKKRLEGIPVSNVLPNVVYGLHCG